MKGFLRARLLCPTTASPTLFHPSVNRNMFCSDSYLAMAQPRKICMLAASQCVMHSSTTLSWCPCLPKTHTPGLVATVVMHCCISSECNIRLFGVVTALGHDFLVRISPRVTHADSIEAANSDAPDPNAAGLSGLQVADAVLALNV